MTDHEHRDLPSKLFFRIGEVAGLVGVEPHVLRYWEREFRSIRPTKSAKGQRVYSRKDVENLLRVRDLLYRDGFTIAGAKKKLQRASAPAGAEEAGELAPASLPGDVRVLDGGVLDGAVVDTAEDAFVDAQRLAEDTNDGARRDGGQDVQAKLEALRAEVVAFLAELPDDDR